MDIEDIRTKYRNGDYKVRMDDHIKRVSENHVFDENLSVKQNREMAYEHNKMVTEMQHEYYIKNNELHQKLREDVVTYISNAYGMSNEQSAIIESYAHIKYHDYMYDYLNTIDEIAEMVEMVLKTER